MQFDKIVKLSVDDGKLLSDELLEHEDVFVFVDIVQSVHV
jgi:hypothetical protein